MKINIKKMSETAKIPTLGSNYAAGYDLYSDESGVVAPRTTKKFATNIAVEIPAGYFGAVYARSGLATKKGLRLGNSVGVIDEDYRGNVIVAIHNDSDVEHEINTGDRIAQLVVQPYLRAEFNEVDELRNTERGDGGFGSTGKN